MMKHRFQLTLLDMAELADGSIFFSFGDSPPASVAKNVDHVTLSPRNHHLVAPILLPHRWPSQFKRQLPFPIRHGVQIVSEIKSSQKHIRSNSAGSMEYFNQNETPAREVEDDSVESVPGTIKKSEKDGSTLTRLPSRFSRKSPISSSFLSDGNPECKSSESRPQTIVETFNDSLPQLPSAFDPLGGLHNSEIGTSRLQGNKGSNFLFEDLKSLQAANKIDNVQSRSLGKVNLGKDLDQKVDHTKSGMNGCPKEATSNDIMGSGRDDRLTPKIVSMSQQVRTTSPTTLGVSPQVAAKHHSPTRLRSNFARMSPIPSPSNLKVESHHARSKSMQMSPMLSSFKSEKEQSHHAPVRLKSKFIRISPIPTAMKWKDVDREKQASETMDCHGSPQCASLLQEPLITNDRAKLAVKSSKGGKKPMTDEPRKRKSTKDFASSNNIKLGRSHGPATGHLADSRVSRHFSGNLRRDYSRYTVRELRILAKSLKLKGFSKLRRQELVELLQSAEE